MSALDGFAKYDRRSAWLQAPSNRALAKARRKGLRALVSELFGYEHRTLYYGPRTAEAVAPIVARGRDHRPTGDAQTRVWRKVAAPQIFFLHKDGAKATVRFVLPDGAAPRDDRPAAELYSEYLSGNMSALVFQEIRESRGLAYSASSYLDTGDRPRDAAGLLGFVSTQAEKLPVAIETFLSLLPRAKRLERPLLLIHGLADDNVLAANTLQLSSALLAAGRAHSVLPLSGVTHMTPQEVVAENLLRLEVGFLTTHLGADLG